MDRKYTPLIGVHRALLQRCWRYHFLITTWPSYEGFRDIHALDPTWKVSIFGVFLVCHFPHSDWIWRDTSYFSILSPNAGKYGPEKLRIRTLFIQWGVYFYRRKHVSSHRLLFCTVLQMSILKGTLMQGGLNKKKTQLNLCNIFFIFIFNELYLMSLNHVKLGRGYFYKVPCQHSLFNISSFNFKLE